MLAVQITVAFADATLLLTAAKHLGVVVEERACELLDRIVVAGRDRVAAETPAVAVVVFENAPNRIGTAIGGDLGAAGGLGVELDEPRRQLFDHRGRHVAVVEEMIEQVLVRQAPHVHGVLDRGRVVLAAEPQPAVVVAYAHDTEVDVGRQAAIESNLLVA